jgi:hypothetical protein
MPGSKRRGKGASNPVDQAAELTCAAIEDRLIADEYDRAGEDPETANFYRMHAGVCEKEASKLLVVDEPPEIGTGGEVVTKKPDGGRAEACYLNVRNTLEKDPNMISIESSAKRASLLLETGILPTGLDAAHSIEANNSLEKMLAHQMALSHEAAFRNITEANRQEDPLERCRLQNTSCRLMKAFQDGLLALHKIRTGNKQTMIVQHVNVADGGQAVVAGKVGGRAKGGK